MSASQRKRKRSYLVTSDTSVPSDTDDVPLASSTGSNRKVSKTKAMEQETNVIVFGPPVVKVAVGPNKTQFAVHKQSLDLAQAGRFFNQAFNNGIRESHTGHLELLEDDPDAFKFFLKWLYGSCIDPSITMVPKDLLRDCDNPRVLRLYTFAHKYLIHDLEDFTMSELYDRLYRCDWRNTGIDGDTITHFLDRVSPESHMHKLLAMRFIKDALSAQVSNEADEKNVDDFVGSLPDRFVQLITREIFKVKFNSYVVPTMIWGKKSDYLLRKP
ncbi:hypothetical protein SLS53_001812 [Cytospora paraplurivora]|uniref:BTB domain-containing protein n=1 Tax=Cytospora paraplurivora TaxID=2898453 RepID=A0AAN9YKX5_9PEZI